MTGNLCRGSWQEWEWDWIWLICSQIRMDKPELIERDSHGVGLKIDEKTSSAARALGETILEIPEVQMLFPNKNPARPLQKTSTLAHWHGPMLCSDWLLFGKARAQLEVHSILAYGSSRRSMELLWDHDLLRVIFPKLADYLIKEGQNMWVLLALSPPSTTS